MRGLKRVATLPARSERVIVAAWTQRPPRRRSMRKTTVAARDSLRRTVVPRALLKLLGAKRRPVSVRAGVGRVGGVTGAVGTSGAGAAGGGVAAGGVAVSILTGGAGGSVTCTATTALLDRPVGSVTVNLAVC